MKYYRIKIVNIKIIAYIFNENIKYFIFFLEQHKIYA